MNKTKHIILPIVLSILVILALIVAMIFSKRIAMNPAGTVGNTAGNLNNGGLFCEYDGTVYFSNKTEGGSLYAMKPDESEIKRLNTLKVGNILAGGKYLYYFQTGSSSEASSFGQIEGMKSFNRCRLNGSDIITLTKDVVVTGQLVDNYLYFLVAKNSGPIFYKIKIDNSERVDLADYIINPACAVNGTIYYNNTQDEHYLYALNTANDTTSLIWKGNLWYPVLEDDYVYYLDVENNYRLCRYSLSRNSIQVLTDDRVDCFNVGGGYVYYQKNGQDAALKCMLTDGSNVQVIAEGNYTNINMTSRYVYFQEFGNDSAMYHTPVGSSSYSSFLP